MSQTASCTIPRLEAGVGSLFSSISLYVSKGGISSFPIYFMFLFCLPRRVKLRLDRIQRDFHWGGGSLDKKPHLVKWAIVCSDKKEGGAGY